MGVGSHASFVLLLSAPLLLALVAIAAIIWNRTRNPDSILSVNMVAIPPDGSHTVWINTIKSQEFVAKVLDLNGKIDFF